MDPVQLATLASWVTASVALVALGAGAIYRMGKLTQNVEDLRREMYAETRRLDEKNDIQFAHVDQRFTDMDRKFEQRFTDIDRRFDELQALILSENAQTRAQIQQLSNALMSHSHDTDGTITFRVPPPAPEE